MRHSDLLQYRSYFFAVLLAFASGGCSTGSGDLERPDDPARPLTLAANRLLPPKTEIAFPPLPLTRRAHLIHRGSPVAGYELVFADRGEKTKKDTRSFCRLTCIGGDCAITPTSESQLFLQQGTFVVSYARMLERSNRMIAFLASLNRTFLAPLVFLECTFANTVEPVTLEGLLALLPPGAEIDSQKNKNFTLEESLPGSGSTYEVGTHKCFGNAANPFPKAAVFALTSKGMTSYDARGKKLDYKIPCRAPAGGVCRKISDFLDSNGGGGCLF